jgi:hypothetical protein
MCHRFNHRNIHRIFSLVLGRRGPARVFKMNVALFCPFEAAHENA